MSLRKISENELQRILADHALWLESGGTKGERADLRDADLQGANLREAYLQRADLRGADLRGAQLRGANLQGVDLQEVSLRGANLSGADLRGALCDASIQKAWNLINSKWLYSGVPWWLGHEDQNSVILCDQ